MIDRKLVPVILESPYGGDHVKRNIEYARKATLHSLYQGEAPFVSHLLYTQKGILNDLFEDERELGILAGFVWRKFAVKTVVYIDYGITKGMIEGINHANKFEQNIEYRTILGD